ncbi:hypothetical protein WN944_000501 [Citrus x changshan-huyou]|uniref:Uncharacterized protein n=1 Tax=Citrus x changshan-huyou TaxID=2935761 RepID=A0AAP0MD02_9ROSI
MRKWQWRVGDGGADADDAGGGCTALHERFTSQPQPTKTESANAKREEMMPRGDGDKLTVEIAKQTQIQNDIENEMDLAKTTPLLLAILPGTSSRKTPPIDY